jgi:hypothetical protein
MKFLIVMLAIVFLTACSSGGLPLTETEKMRIVCLDGVEYYLFREISGYSGWGYMSVKFNPDSTVSTC